MNIYNKSIWSKSVRDQSSSYGTLKYDFLYIDLSEQYVYIISSYAHTILRLRANNGDFVDQVQL